MTGASPEERQRIVAAICAEISKGRLVKAACARAKISRDTLHRWCSGDVALSDAYARAREEQAHAIAEEALTIADSKTVTTEEVARNRLRVDTRKWLASKIAPRSYGEKVTQEYTGEVKHEHRGEITWGGVKVPL